MRVGRCLAVVAQWQNTGGSSQRCSGFDCWWWLAFSIFSLITSKFISFQREARCSEHIAVSFHPMLLDAGNNHLAAHSAQTPAKQDIPFPGISGGTSEEAVFALTKPDKKLYSILSNANIYY